MLVGSPVALKVNSFTKIAYGFLVDGSVHGNLVQKEAGWKHSDLAMTVVFKDKMWLMGGWYNGRMPDHSSGNEVWCSTDGVKWEQVTSSAVWTPRLAAGAIVFKDKMWILGGIENYYFGNEKSLKNDVWYSSQLVW